MATLRICFVGDSITVGSGDTNFLGWPGRLSVAETERGHDVTLYNMGVRGDTSEMVRPRWRSECGVRLPDHVNGRLVLSFGLNDTAEESGVGIRVPLAQSLANARAIVDEARGWLPTVMIGPIPIIDDMQPYVFPNGIAYHYTNARVAELNTQTASLCTELDVPYLNVFDALQANPTWTQSQRDCDGVHATGEGYQLIADMIANWQPWRDWLYQRPLLLTHLTGFPRLLARHVLRRGLGDHKRSRRSAIEAVIGHCKTDGHLGRNFLKGRRGDHINAVMSAVGYNLRLILKWLRKLLRKIIAAFWGMITPISTLEPAS